MFECKTCEEIEFWKSRKIEGTKEKIYAKICVYTWDEKQRATLGEEFSRITSRARKLNYCPTCGKKLKGQK